MKKILTALAIILTAQAAQAAPEKYKFDENHTNIIWHANHLGFSNPFGYFPDIEGYVLLDEAAPENSKINVTIETDELETPIDKFTEHLRGEDFFNVKKFPEARFVSTKVEKTGDNTAKVTGDFTLLGVTKPLVLDVTLNKIGENPMTKVKTAGFSAKTTIKRSEFGMNYGLPNVSDEVQISIETELMLDNVPDKK